MVCIFLQYFLPVSYYLSGKSLALFEYEQPTAETEVAEINLMTMFQNIILN